MKRKRHFKSMNWLMVVAFLIMAGWSPTETRAAEGKYPNRLINVVIPVTPGATDMVIRLFTDKMQEYLGQPFAFVYKPAGGGVIGLSSVAKAKPDGYTLLGSAHLNVILQPITRDVDFKFNDFVPICRLVRVPSVLTVKADSPWKTLKDIVEAAKKSPGTLNYSIVSITGPSHLAMEMFVQSAGLNIIAVPTTGAGASVTALLGGHVTMTNSTVAPVIPHIKSGALRPIAVFEKERLKDLPNVPTFTELGYPVVASQWTSLFAPAGTSEEVVRTLNVAVERVIKDHKNFLDDRLEKVSLILDFGKPEEFAKELRTENEHLEKLVKELLKAIKR